jgi:amino acid transporter
MPLKRILGAPTAWCIGMGVAIGSGIFRTPGDIAAQLPSTTLIVIAWIVGGVIVLIQAL